MTEKFPIEDNREHAVMAIPYLRVVRLQEHPYDKRRGYCVMQKMLIEEDGDYKYAGWKHISKVYAHSTSAFAALGRLVQKYREHNYRYSPNHER